MSFTEFISWLGFQNKLSFWGVLVFLASIGIEVVPQIKWSPWSALLKWLGNRFNDRIDRKVGALGRTLDDKIEALNRKIDEQVGILDTKVDVLHKDLTDHVSESENKNLQDMRRDILDFCNACINRRKHTREQFEFVIHQCDYYEKYIKERDIKNGVIEAAIKEIRRLYEKCMQEHSFLKEGEETSNK